MFSSGELRSPTIISVNNRISWQVELVKEVLPATPLKNLAAQFKLPASFYNHTEPCPGCVGCEEDDNG